MNLVDSISLGMRQAFQMFARDVYYKLTPTGEQAVVKGFLRGVRSDDLFAGALQQDQVAILDAEGWKYSFPSREKPQRLDRIATVNQTFAVEAWRGAPNDDKPVFYKILLRGGSQ